MEESNTDCVISQVMPTAAGMVIAFLIGLATFIVVGIACRLMFWKAFRHDVVRTDRHLRGDGRGHFGESSG